MSHYAGHDIHLPTPPTTMNDSGRAESSGNDPAEAPPLLVDHRGPVTIVSLNRPHRLNAVTLELYQSLRRTLEELAREPGVRPVVLTGSGRAFCVGADLRAHGEAEPGPEERRVYVQAAQRANRAVQRYPWPVVAAVNGHAVGAGLELALSADLVVMASGAKLRLPEVSLGTFLGGGVTYTLPARVGAARARELIFLGRFLSGEEAGAIGLANEVLPAEEVLPRSLALAEELARQAPRSLRSAKELLARAPGRSRQAALDAEARALLECMGTEDWREGIRAFHEKRPPTYTGQ